MAKQISPQELSQCSFFGGLNPQQCEYVSMRMIRCQLEPGDIVYEEGDRAGALYVVASGTLEAHMPSLSDDLALVQLGAGDLFGDMSYIDMQPRSATVEAVVPTVVWRLEYNTLREVYLVDSQCYLLLVMNIAREMSRRLRRSDKKRMTRHGVTAEPRRTTQSKSVIDVIAGLGMKFSNLGDVLARSPRLAIQKLPDTDY